ncbi:MAG: hypothetical protein ABSF59_12120 [Candidatus Sulfotelmatobacter sp.]
MGGAATELKSSDGTTTIYAAQQRILKEVENHCHMVAIYHAHYHFCRVHQTLHVTPAMEAGTTDHVWSLQELALLENKELAKAA